ncbi:MAG: hypothetical protein M0T84_11475 [Betaproteobacteria bacterium]|nr:hypothetical protein [Betaproteobacteria bacterium]
MEVGFSSQWRLLPRRPGASWVIADGTGVHGLQYLVGKGIITVLSDGQFMENPHIGAWDNAAFFWALTHFHRSGEVWLVYSADMPSLAAWLWSHAWAAVTSSVALLAVWLWTKGQRFGPRIAQPPLARRRLLEHIDASGRFLWRSGRHTKLVEGARRALLEQLEWRYPGVAHLPTGQQREYLARLSGVAPEIIEDALGHGGVQDVHTFVTVIRVLDTIRKKL